MSPTCSLMRRIWFHSLNDPNVTVNIILPRIQWRVMGDWVYTITQLIYDKLNVISVISLMIINIWSVKSFESVTVLNGTNTLF